MCTANGKRQFVPHDLVFLLLVLYHSFLQIIYVNASGFMEGSSKRIGQFLFAHFPNLRNCLL